MNSNTTYELHFATQLAKGPPSEYSKYNSYKTKAQAEKEQAAVLELDRKLILVEVTREYSL
jgi:hypothetical protein